MNYKLVKENKKIEDKTYVNHYVYIYDGEKLLRVIPFKLCYWNSTDNALLNLVCQEKRAQNESED